MRIISGDKRGTKLMTLEGLNTRPTTDRIKESLFNLIQFDIPESRVLDLFSGSGALGLEAASRGAAHVVLVERFRPCHKIIEFNIEKCGFDNIDLIKGDVLPSLTRLNDFDVIIMDPPYSKDMVVPVIEAIHNHQVLNEDGIIVVEHAHVDLLPDKIGPFVCNKSKKYGITQISIYRYDS